MSGILLPVCSVFFSILLALVYFNKKRVRLIENDVFSYMLIISICDSIIVSILQFLAISDMANIFSIALLNKLDFILLILFTNCLFLYTIIISFKDSAKHMKKILLGCFSLDAFFAILIMLNNVVLIKNGDSYSAMGGAIYPTGVLCAIYIASTIFVALLNVQKNDKRYIPMYVLVGMLIFLFFSYSYNPYLIIISIALTFMNYIMFFTIENPDMKLIEELQIARDQAEKANRAKTDFLSSMSHEIRTPLNAIVGFSDCIMEAETLTEAKENAQDIVNASQTLLEIVNGILDISKIEAGKIEIANSKYNAYETFNELAKLITPKMNEKGLDFSYKIAEDLPQVLYGDHANLKKIITNLLSNACKYTERGFVHYEVNCINTKGVCKLIISVEDSGRGIKQENINKLFTKFQRLDEDRNTTIEGTGLGLAITKQLVELMGGRIVVHTIYGQGSKFTIVLTQKIEHFDEKEIKKVKTTLDLKDVNILLVDDTALNLKVATKLLEKYGANKISLCSSGFECLDKIQNKETFDIILLDDMMPKMSGVETLKKLKEIPGFNTPVIALTANAISGMREKYLADGFDDYLAKPIEKEQLIQVVNNVLGRSITEELTAINDKAEELIKEEEQKDLEEKNSVIPVTDEDLENTMNLTKLNLNAAIESAKETIPIEPVEDVVEELETSGGREYLESQGCDVNHALELLGDMEMYNMTIQDFMSEVETKWDRIINYKNSNDLENYSIEVHSLKSDCKYLGFMTLADIAYDHELKSKDNDITFVNNDFARLEDEYKKVLAIARTYVNNLGV